MESDARKAKVTAEHLQEAQALKRLWDAAADRPSQAVFGERYEIGNQSAVGQFLRGLVPLSQKAAIGFARGLGCDIADFSPRLAARAAEVVALGASAVRQSEAVEPPSPHAEEGQAEALPRALYVSPSTLPATPSSRAAGRV
jgi:hypothetical protein